MADTEVLFDSKLPLVTATPPSIRTGIAAGFTLFFCCPGLPLLGAVLALTTIPAWSSFRGSFGRRAAILTLLLGLGLTIGQGFALNWAWRNVYEPVIMGPHHALTDGFAGRTTEFTEAFSEDRVGSTPDEAAAEVFIGKLRDRYGDFESATLDRNASTMPEDGNMDRLEGKYVLRFALDTRTATVKFTLVGGGQKGALRIGSLVVPDESLGELAFPPLTSQEGEGDR